ncbi:vacuolar amino acid transporter 4 [Scheffersomyces xylosifermentans]|uniref:vacuolar amino acid transporter 4 n=1 Tax=Scheffersomyces xylosifermentans TaxID=1304137 RepID=UPI00315D2262
MSAPLNIVQPSSSPSSRGSQPSSRRRSIALLTRSPIYSPIPVPNSPNRGNSASNSYVANSTFLRAQDAGNIHDNEDAIDSHSSNDSSTTNLIQDTSPVVRIPPTDNTDVDFSAGIDDPKLLESVAEILPHVDSLKSEGADITRDLYKLGQEAARSRSRTPTLRRAKSYSSMDGSNARERRESASSFNVPGGFRREFILQQSINNNNKAFNKESLRTKTPNFLTRNFVEFLSIYGHFAGEELEDEDAIACHYKAFHPFKHHGDEESLPLLARERELQGNDYINPKGTATDKKAYFLLLKAFVGTGVLFLPKAFSNGGLLFSILTLLFFGILSLWCYLTLVYSKIATKVSSFAELGLKLYGNWLQRLILFSIVISQIGFVAAYIVFTSENLRAFLSTVTGYDTSEFDIVWFIIFQVIVLVPLSLVRDITKLSLSAVLANLFILVGLVTILYYIFYEWLVTNKGVLGSEIEYFFNESEFSLFIGVAIFAFEGIGLIIPIQESMVYPNHFPKVLCQVIATISTIFVAMGTLGYLTFGKEIQTVIILNLPQKSPMIVLIQLLYSFAILLSTPLQLFPAIRLLESKLFFTSGKYSTRIKWLKNLFRFIFVSLVAYVAFIGGQNLDKFVSFVGCFACIPLVYMYPPILHLKSCCKIEEGMEENEKRRRYWLGILDYVLVVIGGVAMVYTTYDILAH